MRNAIMIERMGGATPGLFRRAMRSLRITLQFSTRAERVARRHQAERIFAVNFRSPTPWIR